MSHTVKGKKGPGYEYWSRRPSKMKYPDPGRVTKTITHRQERRIAKRTLNA